MRRTGLHLEVIRDKDTIYEQLLKSKSKGYQLAICYRTDDNLTVRICRVSDVSCGNNGIQITLRANAEDGVFSGQITESVIGLEKIESIYPIHAFQKSS